MTASGYLYHTYVSNLFRMVELPRPWWHSRRLQGTWSKNRIEGGGANKVTTTTSASSDLLCCVLQLAFLASGSISSRIQAEDGNGYDYLSTSNGDIKFSDTFDGAAPASMSRNRTYESNAVNQYTDTKQKGRGQDWTDTCTTDEKYENNFFRLSDSLRGAQRSGP